MWGYVQAFHSERVQQYNNRHGEKSTYTLKIIIAAHTVL